MMHPKKWRETQDPYLLRYKNFKLLNIIGYPYAGNNVFYANGIYNNTFTDVYIKIARQNGADIQNEFNVINKLKCKQMPEIIGYDEQDKYIVTKAKEGERLSTIVGDNTNHESTKYLFEYGSTLARIHATDIHYFEVKDRKFFHIPDQKIFSKLGIEYVFDYLVNNRPKEINKCFCHGDFHYANIYYRIMIIYQPFLILNYQVLVIKKLLLHGQ